MSGNIYLRVTKWLGGIALCFFAFGVLFGVLTPSIFSEEALNSVLLNAIPFFSIFVGILLLFILTIALLAIRFNGKIPGRTYRGVENTIIATILIAVVCLFQPWNIVPYRYGFVLLLLSTLAFIVWSHIAPPRADYDQHIPALTPQQHLIGAVAGLLVVVVLTASAVSANAPQPPYGLRQRVWNSYDDARKAQVAADATASFNNVEFPFLIALNSIPGILAYMVAREIASGGKRREETPTSPVPAAAGGD
jgi:hypothetical protein